jgi:gliding motility-associated-like protein
MKLNPRYFLVLLFALISILGFSQECDIIYVSPNGSGSGTQAAPTSLLNGLTLVVPGVDHIRMASGTYNISNTIDLIGGVTIEGGFDAVTWVKSNNAATLIHRDNTNVTPAPDRIIAMSAFGLINFQLHDLSVLVDNAGGSGTSTYGIHIDGCSNYSLSRVRSTAGNGSNGIDGLAGTDGVVGVDGLQGQNGNNCGGGNTAGGVGGNSWGGGISAGGNGGDGGPEGTSDRLDCCTGTFIPLPFIVDGEAFPGLPGQDGLGPNPGIGGLEGPGYENALSACLFIVGQCTAPVSSYGQLGVDATDGTDGIVGLDGIPVHAGGFFVPGDGEDGVNGEDGSGGGGGGGGGSHGDVLNILGINADNGSGPGGGGGGEGGQGGSGATGGSGGGGSFGIYISNNGSGGILNDCVANSGLPGIGGVGGFPGGLGGQGGLGGFGGIGCGQGGQGGEGSAGGNGGNGGNGAPGTSQPLYEEPTGIQTIQTSLAANVEPNITLESTGCTFSDIYYSTNSNGIIEWFYEGSTVPVNTIGQSTSAYYNGMGSFDLTMVANGVPYFLAEFVNIFIDGSPYLPTIQASDTTCPGNIVNFSATWPINFNVLGYRWAFGDPASGAANTSSSAAPSYTYADAGTYMVTLQTESPCCGWSKPDTHYVEVLPFVTPEVFITATSTEICEGEEITFGAVPFAGGDSPSYQWVRDGIDVPPAFGGDANSYTPIGIANGEVIRVEMESDYACPLVNPVSSDNITIIVHPIPVVDCSNVTDAYLGANTGFNADITVGTAPYEFFWQFGDGGSSTDQSPAHLYGGTGLYNASLEVTDTFGCSVICEVTVDIILPPFVYAGFLFDTVQTCGSTTVTFTDTTFGNPITWEWDFGDGNQSSVQNPSHTYASGGPYTITLAASNGVFTDTMVIPNLVEPWLVPVAEIMMTDSTACDSTAIRFFDNSENAAAWEWDFGDLNSGPLNVSNLQNPAHAFNDSGSYVVTLTVFSIDGCASDAIPVNIDVYASPIAGFWVDTNIVCAELPILFNDTSKYDANITNWSYHFSDKDTTITVDGSVTDLVEYTFDEPGWYTVTQYVRNRLTGCKDSAKISMEVRPHPVADFYPDSVALQLPDTTMEFWNTSYNVEPDSSYWDFGNGYTVDNMFDAVGIYQDSGLFDVQLIVMREIGCPDTLTVPFRVWEQETFFIQTAFTPNGDGTNDVFEIKQRGITDWHLQIYDRWGKLQWETFNVTEFWDGTSRKSGKELPQGAYSYQIDLTWYKGQGFSKMGTITIFR